MVDMEMYLTLAFDVRIVVQIVWDNILILENKSFLEVKDHLYAFEFGKNLILISSLRKMNYSFISLRSLVENLYHVTLLLLLLRNENNHISLKRNETNTNQTYFWHLCLSYINLNKI